MKLLSDTLRKRADEAFKKAHESSFATEQGQCGAYGQACNACADEAEAWEREHFAKLRELAKEWRAEALGTDADANEQPVLLRCERSLRALLPNDTTTDVVIVPGPIWTLLLELVAVSHRDAQTDSEREWSMRLNKLVTSVRIPDR